jgi:hypothetical protein
MPIGKQLHDLNIIELNNYEQKEKHFSFEHQLSRNFMILQYHFGGS